MTDAFGWIQTNKVTWENVWFDPNQTALWALDILQIKEMGVDDRDYEIDSVCSHFIPLYYFALKIANSKWLIKNSEDIIRSNFGACPFMGSNWYIARNCFVLLMYLSLWQKKFLPKPYSHVTFIGSVPNHHREQGRIPLPAFLHVFKLLQISCCCWRCGHLANTSSYHWLGASSVMRNIFNLHKDVGFLTFVFVH